MGFKGVGEDIDKMILDTSLKFSVEVNKYLWIPYIVFSIYV